MRLAALRRQKAIFVPVWEEINGAGISFGGAISGEHGIGLDKKAYFRREMDDALLNIMRKTKKAFDPNKILNPGKIFDL
jgi:glycolate oxidase